MNLARAEHRVVVGLGEGLGVESGGPLPSPSLAARQWRRGQGSKMPQSTARREESGFICGSLGKMLPSYMRGKQEKTENA